MRSIQAIGMSLAAILVLADSVSAQSLRDGLAKAYNTNPSLAAERARLHAQDEKVPQALSGWRPTVNLTGRFNREYTDSVTDFTFSAGEAFRIHNGKIEELCRPVMLTGNLFTTLESLDAVANDLGMNQGGGCGKGGQMPLPVSNGSPHIRIQRCLIGGA